MKKIKRQRYIKLKKSEGELKIVTKKLDYELIKDIMCLRFNNV